MPTVRITWNSTIPTSVNDGPMWAGRGLNLWVMGGGTYSLAMGGITLRATLAPGVTFSQNQPFDFLPDTASGRSSFASPFHGPESSADLPSRFGDRGLLRADPGTSELAVQRGRFAVRVTAANDWWGPGIRNTLLMSSNAPGIPRLELGVSGLRTAAGLLDARAIAGTLTESMFFDDLANDYRSLSGVVASLRPAFDTGLTVGLARIVYAPIQSPLSGTLAHALDFLFRWDRIPVLDTATGTRAAPKSDQITSLFARWAFPGSGLEIYLEWARSDLPHTLEELVTAAHHSGAYVVGTQYARPRPSGDVVRVQLELTYLEQSRVFAERPPADYYTSLASAQGYTQRGQSVGAAIGPGASSQWLALDYIAPAWQAGWYAERTRWENDAMYRQFAANFTRHDVTVATGIRGALRTRWTDVSADVRLGYRFNYLFQGGYANPGGYRTVDVRNLTLSFAATPR